MKGIKIHGLIISQTYMLKHSAIIVLLMLAGTVRGQNFIDLAKLYYTHSPNNSFDTTSQASDMTEVGAEILVPIPLKNGNAIITGLAYEKATLRPGPQVAKPVDLYLINPRIGINWVHNSKWTGQYIVLPQISSDLEGKLQGHDFQLGAIGIANYKKTEHLTYRFGAYYNGALYGPGTFIIAGFFLQKPESRWTFDFMLPIWADINYRLTDVWSIGLRQDDMLRSYYLNKPLFTNSDEYLVELSPDTYLYLQAAIAKNFILQFKVGHSIGRSYRVYNVGDKIDLGFSGINVGDDRNELSTDFADGLIFQVRFHYRFFLDDYNK